MLSVTFDAQGGAGPMTLTFLSTSAGSGPHSAPLKFYIYSAEIAIPLRSTESTTWSTQQINLWPTSHFRPKWKINSFLSEISVCWSCTEKITIKIERAFSAILLASPATRRSFQLSTRLPTVTAANLGFNAQLATANARWRLASLSIRCPYVDKRLLS